MKYRRFHWCCAVLAEEYPEHARLMMAYIISDRLKELGLTLTTVFDHMYEAKVAAKEITQQLKYNVSVIKVNVEAEIATGKQHFTPEKPCLILDYLQEHLKEHTNE